MLSLQNKYKPKELLKGIQWLGHNFHQIRTFMNRDVSVVDLNMLKWEDSDGVWRLAYGDWICKDQSGRVLRMFSSVVHENYDILEVITLPSERRYECNGKLHRADGPAVERANGKCEYWIRGTRMSREDFFFRQYLATIKDIHRKLDQIMEIMKEGK